MILFHCRIILFSFFLFSSKSDGCKSNVHRPQQACSHVCEQRTAFRPNCSFPVNIHCILPRARRTITRSRLIPSPAAAGSPLQPLPPRLRCRQPGCRSICCTQALKMPSMLFALNSFSRKWIMICVDSNSIAFLQRSRAGRRCSPALLFTVTFFFTTAVPPMSVRSVIFFFTFTLAVLSVSCL